MFLRQVLTDTEETEIFTRLTSLDQPVVFDRHFYQPDWSRREEVNLVNLVREPVSRMISQYYYLRSPSRWSWRPEKPPQAWMTKDLSSCVLEADLECEVGGGGQDMQLSYFCGSHLQCSNSSNPLALQAAKYNLENRWDTHSLHPDQQYPDIGTVWSGLSNISTCPWRCWRPTFLVTSLEHLVSMRDWEGRRGTPTRTLNLLRR